MKKRLTALAAFLFIMLQAAPALAGVNLNVNGQTYQSMAKPLITAGITMVTLDTIERIIGADCSLSGKDIIITNNQDVLKMTRDSKNATINGKALVLSAPPTMLNYTIMVPARGVFEALGAKVGWQADNQTLTLLYNEQNQGMNAGEIFDKMKTALDQCNSYQAKVSAQDISYRESPGKPGSREEYSTQQDMDMSRQTTPLLVYCKLMAHRIDIEDPAGFKTQIVANEKGVFSKNNEHEWQIMPDPDMTVEEMIDMADSEDPVFCLKYVRKTGAILSLGNEICENGRDYWVINVTLSQEALPNVHCGALRGSSLFYCPREMTDYFQKLLRNTQAEMHYRVIIDQETCLPSLISFDSQMVFRDSKTVRGDETLTGDASAASISTAQHSGYCKLYGFGESFTVPDVSKARPYTPGPQY